MTVPCGLADSTIFRKSAPFGAILRAARSQRRGWVKPHPYITTRKRAFSTNRTGRIYASPTNLPEMGALSITAYLPSVCREGSCPLLSALRMLPNPPAGWCRPHKPFRHNKKPHHAVWHSAVFGAPAGTRILDPLIKSQMLYQLSYEHICVCCVLTALIL